MHRLPPSECSPFTIFGAKISRVGRVEIYTSRSDHVCKNPACCDGDIMQPGHQASGMSRIKIPAIVCARIYGTVDKRAAAPIYDSGVGCEPAFDQTLGLLRQYYCLPRGRRSLSSLRASSRVRSTRRQAPPWIALKQLQPVDRAAARRIGVGDGRRIDPPQRVASTPRVSTSSRSRAGSPSDSRQGRARTVAKGSARVGEEVVAVSARTRRRLSAQCARKMDIPHYHHMGFTRRGAASGSDRTRQRQIRPPSQVPSCPCWDWHRPRTMVPRCRPLFRLRRSRYRPRQTRPRACCCRGRAA